MKTSVEPKNEWNGLWMDQPDKLQYWGQTLTARSPQVIGVLSVTAKTTRREAGIIHVAKSRNDHSWNA
jgi:hypothetical protein